MTTTRQGFEQFFNPEAFKSFTNPNAWNAEGTTNAYRRNMEAVTSVGQVATEITKNMFQAQTNYAREAMDDMAQFWRNWLSAGTNMQDRLEIQNKATQDSWNKAISHNQELTNLIQKSQEKFLRTMNDRFAESMNEASDVAKRAAKTK